MPRARLVIATVALLAQMAVTAAAAPARAVSRHGSTAASRASAVRRHGITPLSPARDDAVPKGKAPTFRLRVRGAGQVWVRVCRSARKARDGVICDRLAVGRAHRRKGGMYTFKPRFRDFPGFWLNTPGSYHWQAYRVACVDSDCRAEGPIVRFRVA